MGDGGNIRLDAQAVFPWWEPPAIEVKASDSVLSPPWVADWLGAWADLDPCGHPRQVVAARRVFLWPADDGLARPWSCEWLARLVALSPLPVQTVYCNCPFSAPGPWVAQAELALRHGLSVVMLLRGDTSTAWADAAIDAAHRHGGWAGLTRERVLYGRVRTEGEPTFDLQIERGGALMVAAGPACPRPPAGRLRLFERPATVCVPLRTNA